MSNYQSRFLQDICQNDQQLMEQLVTLSIASVEKAIQGIREGLRTNDGALIRQNIHLAKPNLVHLDLERYVEKLERSTDLNSVITEVQNELTKSKKILKVSIIEDDPAYQAILARYVNDHPYLTLESIDNTVIEGALNLCKKKPDILFLDIILDGLDGFDIIEMLEEYKPKIIVVSSDHSYQELADQYGVVGFVAKPIGSLEQLETQVNKCFELA